MRVTVPMLIATAIVLAGCGTEPNISTAVSTDSTPLALSSSSIAATTSSDPLEDQPYSGEYSPPEVTPVPEAEESTPEAIGKFTLRVLDSNGIAVTNAHIEMFDVPSDTMPVSAWTNSLGETKLNWPEAGFTPFKTGNYTFKITSAALNAKSSVEEKEVSITPENIKPLVIKLQSEYHPLTLEAAPNGVEVFVHDSEGDPVPDVWITMFVSGMGWPDTQGQKVKGEGFTDGMGRIVFENINNTTYTINMGHGGAHLYQSQDVVIDSESREISILLASQSGEYRWKDF